MRIYLDVSCLNRPFDDQWQERIRIESEAVTLILEACASGKWQHVSSAMALVEIAAISDRDKRRKVRTLLPKPVDIMDVDEGVFRRAAIIEGLGFSAADAVHVAAAERHGCDVMLTCDDGLLRRAREYRGQLAIEVENPVVWFQGQRDETNT